MGRKGGQSCAELKIECTLSLKFFNRTRSSGDTSSRSLQPMSATRQRAPRALQRPHWIEASIARNSGTTGSGETLQRTTSLSFEHSSKFLEFLYIRTSFFVNKKKINQKIEKKIFTSNIADEICLQRFVRLTSISYR